MIATMSSPATPGRVPGTAASRPAALSGVSRALVVGLGRSGRAAARLLSDAGVEVTVADDAPAHPEADAARAAGWRVRLGGVSPADLDGRDLVVPSPGVPEHAPVLRAALAAGLPVWSEPELALRVVPRPLLAVTGTNGKTSTTELVAAMLSAAGHDALACGNIGTPVAEAVGAPASTRLVAELSSFQLRFAGRLRPRVGALLNVAADHLDWHGDLDAYGAAKARLWEAQSGDDWAVANADDPRVRALLERAPAGRAHFSGSRAVPLGVGSDGTWLHAAWPDGARRPLLEIASLASRAPHHLANVAAAATVALLDGTPADAVAEAARRFVPGPHRGEIVADAHGVRWVDDSKATNPHAAAASLRSARSIVWIAGGRAKGVDLGVLGAELGAVRHALLIGEAAPALREVCATAGVEATLHASLEDAVAAAVWLARSGDTVLLAPACASLDQFRDYAERGERFAAAARAAAAAAPTGRDRPRPTTSEETA